MIADLHVSTPHPRRCFLISSVEPNLVTVEAVRFISLAELRDKRRRKRAKADAVSSHSPLINTGAQ